MDEAFDIMQRGGPLMWAILAVSCLCLALACERAFVLWVRLRLDVDAFVNHVMDLCEEGEVARAIEVCTAEARHPFADIARAGLLRAGGSERELQRAMEACALAQYPALTRRTGALWTLANVATLLGLLGTVLGLIDAFSGLTEADTAAKGEILARGIGVAMYTTAFGLCTSIVALLLASVLQARQTQLLAAIEAKATELLSYLVERPRGAQKRVG